MRCRVIVALCDAEIGRAFLESLPLRSHPRKSNCAAIPLAQLAPYLGGGTPHVASRRTLCSCHARLRSHVSWMEHTGGAATESPVSGKSTMTTLRMRPLYAQHIIGDCARGGRGEGVLVKPCIVTRNARSLRACRSQHGVHSGAAARNAPRAGWSSCRCTRL